MIGIYKIENQINGKAYIGQSINIEQRWKTHIREGKNYHEGGRGYAIHKAISKYGVENFSFVVLEECKEEELNDREKYWISQYDSYYNGYNCTKGGDGATDHFKKRVFCYNLNGEYLEEFESVKEAAEFLGINPMCISNCCSGKQRASHGFQFSHKKKTMGKTIQTLGSAKRVGQYTKDGELVAEYPSASDAARAMNLTKHSIADCCRGRQKTSAGYIWKYI